MRSSVEIGERNGLEHLSPENILDQVIQLRPRLARIYVLLLPPNDLGQIRLDEEAHRHAGTIIKIGGLGQEALARVIDETHVERRAQLDELNLIGSAWCTVSSFAGDGPEVMAACVALGLEGVVAKRLPRSTDRAPAARTG